LLIFRALKVGARIAPEPTPEKTLLARSTTPSQIRARYAASVTRTLQRRRLISCLVILAAAFALGEPAVAEPRPETERARLERQLAELKRRARELQEQILRIEAQLAPPAPPAATASFPDDCKLPFYMDRTGLKRVRSECLQSNKETSCEMPFMLDDSGIRRVRPECGSESPALARPSDE
jgi:hypothetical protein